jgi:hypothetical protein
MNDKNHQPKRGFTMRQLTERQNDDECFINCYKDVNGFKPRGHHFFDATDAERSRIMQSLSDDMDYEVRMQIESDHMDAIMIENLIVMGAADATTAFSWMRG